MRSIEESICCEDTDDGCADIICWEGYPFPVILEPDIRCGKYGYGCWGSCGMVTTTPSLCFFSIHEENRQQTQYKPIKTINKTMLSVSSKARKSETMFSSAGCEEK